MERKVRGNMHMYSVTSTCLLTLIQLMFTELKCLVSMDEFRQLCTLRKMRHQISGWGKLSQLCYHVVPLSKIHELVLLDHSHENMEGWFHIHIIATAQN
jgi:hypothetical protein